MLAGSLVPGSSGDTGCSSCRAATSSAPSVLSLVPPLGTLCSVHWLAVSHGYFDLPSNKDQSVHILVFLLLELHVVCELYLGYSELLG